MPSGVFVRAFEACALRYMSLDGQGREVEMQEREERIAAVRKHEATCHALEAALDDFASSLTRLKQLGPRYDALVRYYESPAWRADYDASNRGAFDGISCGVLSEDTVYDLLMRTDALVREAHAWTTELLAPSKAEAE